MLVGLRTVRLYGSVQSLRGIDFEGLTARPPLVVCCVSGICAVPDGSGSLAGDRYPAALGLSEK